MATNSLKQVIFSSLFLNMFDIFVGSSYSFHNINIAKIPGVMSGADRPQFNSNKPDVWNVAAVLFVPEKVLFAEFFCLAFPIQTAIMKGVQDDQ